MAESSISVSEDQFSCSICLDLLKDPVTIPCGHSYCMSCITDCWDQDDQRVYSCPQCRQTFTPRPVLGKNVLFASMVEKFQIANTVDCNAGPGDVECDVCIGGKRKAVKFCVECIDSYCQNHLEQHKNLFERKRHKLMDASEKLQERICSQHRKLQDIFCRTDQQCICLLCIMDIHKNHDTVSAGAERTEKESHLIETQKKYQQRIQEKQKDLQELRDAVVTYKRSAQAAVEESERIFTELIFLIEINCSEMTQLIRDQEKAEVSQAEEILKRLEQEINDLKKRDAEMEQLLHTDDHIHFLQSFQSLSAPPGSTDSLNITVSSLLSFEEVGKLVSHMREKLENFSTKAIKKISGRVSNVKIIGPRSRQEFLQHSFQFTMEQNTAHKHLCLSEGNRVITNKAVTLQPYPDHLDKFNVHPQVLCRESVCGRCYWEVDWSGRVDISVSYKSISRKGWGDDCFFGRNDQSWSLYCSHSSYSFWHNNIETKLPVVSRSSRIGVYVDHSAGTLSFYSVSDTMTLIHRVHTTFTQPLYPGFRLDYSTILFLLSKVKLCEINNVNISESELY